MRHLAVAVMAVVLTACSSSRGAVSAPRSTSAAAAIAMAGTVSVVDPDGGATVGADGTITVEQTDGPCRLSGGYSDIANGAEVVVSDDAGKTLVITALQSGVFNDENKTCTFPFSAEVPSGKKFYGIEVTHRGVVKMPEAEMAAPKFTLAAS